MKLRLVFAVVVQLVIMGLVLVQPLMAINSGTRVWLETEKMDPRSLFRGDYVILGYGLAQGILDQTARRKADFGTPVYVTITTDRPAVFVAVGFEPPVLAPDQACLVGRHRGSGGSVDFPQIAQYFVPEGEGHELEQARGKTLLAEVVVGDDCKAVLLGLVPR